MSNFSTRSEAQKYVDERCTGFFADSRNDYEIKDDGGCYLTTVTVDYLGFKDNCDQLNTLRYFRDTYLNSTTEGQRDIHHYYSIAPQIVEKINTSNKKDKIINNIYNNLILPCIDLINQKKYKQTHELYKSYTLNLEKELLDK